MTGSIRVDHGPDGLSVVTGAYRFTLPSGSAYATLGDADGERWADLLLDASVHARSGLDETVARQPPLVRGDDERWSVVVPLMSTLWRRKEIRVEGNERCLRVSATVEGEGSIADVHLLGAWSSAMPNGATGFMRSGSAFRSLVSPEPEDPARIVRSATEPATLDVLGGSGPGRLHWFFTPPPYCFAFSRASRPTMEAAATAADEVVSHPTVPPTGREDATWLAVGISARPDAFGFTGVHYEPAERAFSIRLDYEGQTRVFGRFETPEVVLIPGQSDPYAAIGAWADDLRSQRDAPAITRRVTPSWWLEPMFCGWGAQAALSREHGAPPAAHATAATYDRFLDELARHGLRPGTIVIDDRWQVEYGTGEPDLERWPDLGRWIARRHDHGQRVLLWWKAWDPEGVPPELCVRNTRGVPVAVDPSNPRYEALLRRSIRRLLSADGFDADGLKIDFTARTPSGPGLRRHGSEWGSSLLLRLLWIIHDEAHRAKDDALVITHAPHPAFAATADMLRLNDMLRTSEPDDSHAIVAQMEYRARVVAAACPGIPIDTDDWCVPDRATWRRYLSVKRGIGVPALYYTSMLDRTGERLEEEDYAALREVWEAARADVRPADAVA